MMVIRIVNGIDFKSELTLASIRPNRLGLQICRDTYERKNKNKDHCILFFFARFEVRSVRSFAKEQGKRVSAQISSARKTSACGRGTKRHLKGRG